MSERGKSIETESRSGFQGNGVEGRWGVAADGYEVSLRGNKYILKLDSRTVIEGIPGGAVVKNLPANARGARNMGSIPGQEDPLE